MNEPSGSGAAQSWLEEFVRAHGGVAGSVHYRDGATLRLAAAVNIPEAVQKVTAVVPRGKGMAGLALERNQPVSVCNIQTDRSGDVRPGARAVNAQAAAALPVQDSNGQVRAVVGIAFMRDEELPESELQRLTTAASTLPPPPP